MINIPEIGFGEKPVKGAMARLEAEQEARRKESEEQIVQPIDNKNNYWRIQNVQYRNEFHQVDLLKELLDNGNSKTQAQWSEYSKQAKQKGDFYVGDFPLYHSLFTALFNQRNNSSTEEIRAFLQKQFIEKWLMTLTRIKYNPNGKDEIIHNFGMPNQYSINENFVGPDEFIKNSKNTKYLEALLGNKNVSEINSVYQWITQKDAYILRVNSKPEQLVERVARFNAYSVRAGLICGRIPESSSGSLGIRIVREGGIK